jgi:hypothetical protein
MFLSQGKTVQLRRPKRTNASQLEPYPFIIRRVKKSIDEQRRVIWLRFGSLDCMEKQWHTAS